VTSGALYLKTAGRPGVLAVLAHDAVRLPCGLLLPTTSAQLPLTSLAASPLVPWAEFMVGDGAVSWTGPAGPVVVRAVREWAPARPARGEVAASALGTLRARLRGADPAADSPLLADLAAAAADHEASAAAAVSLLGRGPGLTPSGDDVLTGFLVGAAAFGLEAAALREATTVLAPARTTALSAALLWLAARGECIDELAAVVAVLTSQGQGRTEEECRAEGDCRSEGECRAAGDCRSEGHGGHAGRGQAGLAVCRLLSVGHTSGAALGLGLVIAAEGALRARAERLPRAARLRVGATAAASGGRAA
jgi:hypothetical protein